MLGYYLSKAKTNITFCTIDLSGNSDITYNKFYQAHHHSTHHTSMGTCTNKNINVPGRTEKWDQAILRMLV